MPGTWQNWLSSPRGRWARTRTIDCSKQQNAATIQTNTSTCPTSKNKASAPNPDNSTVPKTKERTSANKYSSTPCDSCPQSINSSRNMFQARPSSATNSKRRSRGTCFWLLWSTTVWGWATNGAAWKVTRSLWGRATTPNWLNQSLEAVSGGVSQTSNRRPTSFGPRNRGRKSLPTFSTARRTR